jgi:23S rRNA pseudouridine1911/1915/1917 synthase
MDKIEHLIASESGQRVDKYVADRLTYLSRSRLRQLIDHGSLTVNGAPVKASHRLEMDDQVEVRVPPLERVELAPEHLPLRKVYEDEDLLVVDKPAGLVVHPAPGHPTGTLVNALLARYSDLPEGEHQRPGIVHRLDKDTSGLIIVAKNAQAQRNLQRQFKEGRVRKVYLALVEGVVEPERGLIDAPIGRDPRNRKRMAVIPSRGRQARTEYVVLEHLGDYSLLEVRPQTGRTHQVRVHLAFIGHPVVGDRVYGRRKQSLGLKRQFLHANRLRFSLPSTGREVELVSKLPPDLSMVLTRLREPTFISDIDWERGSSTGQ